MAGPVDMNVFNGTVADLRTLANDAPPPPAPPVVEPSAPLSVATTVGAAGAVTLRWAPPKTTGGALVAYEVAVDGGAPQRLAATVRSHTFTGLAPGPHTFTVAAVNTVGTGTIATTAAALPLAARVAVVRTASGVTATVTRADTGAALPGVTVTVRLRPRAGAAPAPTTAVTDAAGRVAVPVRGPVSTDVSVTVAASASVSAATGTAVVAATPSLALRLSATRVKAGRSVTFTGTTNRLYAGETVYRQSYYGGAWHNRGSAKVKSNGTVSFTVTSRTKSTSTYRLWIPATSAHTAAGSKSVVLRVV
jgi:hypothetical protein